MTEQTLWKKQHPPVSVSALPILTFDQAIALHLDQEEVKVIHLPRGHTDGDSVVFFTQNKIVSMGDLYFSGMYPIFHPEHDGSLEGYVKNIETVLKQISDDYKIVPGHGPLSNKTELERYHQMILASVAVVKREMKAGRTLDQIQKLGLPAKWEPFSHGYSTTDRWIELLYKSIRK